MKATTSHLHEYAHSTWDDSACANRARHTEKKSGVPRGEIRIFDFKGERYVVKPRNRVRWARARAWLSVALCAVLFGEFPSPKRLRAGDIQDEARRLQELRRQGLRVPRVYSVAADQLILEYCGETIEARLGRLAPRDRAQLLARVVDDLANFHRAGHWHGGAQLRNLTISDGRIYRIDFEENVGAALPLPLAQAYDVLLTFNSMTDYLNDAHQQTGVQLLMRYLSRVHSPQIVESLQSVEYWLSHVRRRAHWLGPRLRNNRDLQRTCKFARILTEALEAYKSI